MLKDQIRKTVIQAVQAAQEAGDLPATAIPEPEILRPKQAEHGDYSTNVALITASAVKQQTGEKVNPRAIAQAISAHMTQDGIVGKVDVAGPGFINLHLSERWLQQQVRAIIAAGPQYGNIDRGVGQRWQVEYVSANPVGPLHYGGGRNAVLGDALANVLEAAGYDVQREFYVNDAGTQFGLFAECLYVRYMQLFGHEMELPEGGYPGAYIIDYAKTLREQVGDSLVHLDRDAALAEVRKRGREIVLADLRSELALIGVEFDRWFSEQSLYDEGLVDEVIAKLEAQGDIVDRDGARWFLASKYPGNDKDEVVIRSNGAPTYFASDIAYHYDKFVRRKFDTVVNVWAVDHQGHVPRMAAVMQALGLDPSRLIILLYNLVKLVREGKEVRMSKRAGEFITLREVVEEVGADAVRFMLLTRSPESSVEFDLDLAVAQKNENPVYYVQYGHARICSILRKAEEEYGIDVQALSAEEDETLLSLLTHPAEFDLIRKMLDLEEQIDLAVERLSPHNLTYYAQELARSFSIFYDRCRVLDKDQPDLTRARLLLSLAARVVLARVLALMGMNAPESM
ncbi:MAG: arginine--tRNA ligase [Caldilineae bacterium]|nr:MAG: arginine--tRNA ligase [Caldilineae bacterium]